MKCWLERSIIQAFSVTPALFANIAIVCPKKDDNVIFIAIDPQILRSKINILSLFLWLDSVNLEKRHRIDNGHGGLD